MIRKPILVIMCALLLSIASIPVHSNEQKPTKNDLVDIDTSDVPSELSGIVVDKDDKPVNGATVTAYKYDWQKSAVTERYKAISGIDGRFRIKVMHVKGSLKVPSTTTELQIKQVKNSFYYNLYGMYAETQSSFGAHLRSNNGIEDPVQTKIILCPKVAQPIQVTVDKKPVAHLKMHLTSLNGFNNGTNSYGSCSTDILQTGKWVYETDDNGMITLKDVPKGYSGYLEAVDENYARPTWLSNIKIDGGTEPEKLELFKAGKIIGKVVLPHKYKITRPINCNASSIDRLYDGYTTLNSDGTFTIPYLKEGVYDVEARLPNDLMKEWVCLPAEKVTVTAGKPANISLKLVSGNKVSGRITCKGSKTPSANISISFNSRTGFNLSTVSDEKGSYAVCLPDGNYTIYLYNYLNSQSEESKTITVEKGKSYSLNFEVKPGIPMAPITGTVVDANGKPVPDADILAVHLDNHNTPGVSIKADSKGYFEVNPNSDAASVCLFAHKYQDATEKPVIVDRGTINVKLAIKPNALASFTGGVYDGDKKPLTNKKVELWQDIEMKGLYKAGTCLSDVGGHYTFPVIYPGIKYYVDASGNEGYSNKSSDFKDTYPGAKLEYDLVIRPANSYAAGKVVNKDNKPVANAEIYCRDASSYQRIFSDKDGNFRLENVPEGDLDLSVQVEGENWGKSAIGGKSDNVIVVDDTPAAEREKKQAKFSKMVDDTNAEEMKKAQKAGHTPTYNAVMQQAKASAKSKGVNLLIIFHASWCGPCHVLMEYLRRPNVKEIINRRFELVILDIWENDKTKILENEGAAAKIAQFGGTRYIPYTVVADVNDKVLAKGYGKKGVQFGMPSEPDDINIFMGMLQQNSKMTTDEAAVLRKEIAKSEF